MQPGGAAIYTLHKLSMLMSYANLLIKDSLHVFFVLNVHVNDSMVSFCTNFRCKENASNFDAFLSVTFMYAPSIKKSLFTEKNPGIVAILTKLLLILTVFGWILSYTTLTIEVHIIIYSRVIKNIPLIFDLFVDEFVFYEYVVYCGVMSVNNDNNIFLTLFLFNINSKTTHVLYQTNKFVYF